MIYKKITSLILVAAFLIGCSICVFGAHGTAYNWYCIRTPDNRRPPCPPELAFVKDHGGFFIDNNKKDGDTDKVVYLTFDAGYENGNVPTGRNLPPSLPRSRRHIAKRPAGK